VNLPRPTPIHATNIWNPTGQNLQPVPGCRLWFTHLDTVDGPRTAIFLGTQHHLTFVADAAEHLPADQVRAVVLAQGVAPHLVDDAPQSDLPRPPLREGPDL
jgi:hypothetical protein